jgi:pimeloyl-ACP methyl ester carboxylesterase
MLARSNSQDPTVPDDDRGVGGAPEEDGAMALPGGRRLSYASFGDEDAPVVIVLDGPGSRGLARAAAGAAQSLRLRLVAPDRPGFFGSTPVPGRAIGDWPADHAALLDHLGVERAGILAQSGGTPYAFATAQALPRRVTAIALTGGLAPVYEKESLKESDRQLRGGVTLARRAPWLLRLALRSASRQAAKDPVKAADKVLSDLPRRDAELMREERWHELHVLATKEILGSPDAIAQEIGLLARPWGVDLSAIDTPVALWTGAQDATHPPSHARRLAERLGGAPVHIVDDSGTFGLLDCYADVLAFAAGVTDAAS